MESQSLDRILEQLSGQAILLARMEERMLHVSSRVEEMCSERRENHEAVLGLESAVTVLQRAAKEFWDARDQGRGMRKELNIIWGAIGLFGIALIERIANVLMDHFSTPTP